MALQKRGKIWWIRLSHGGRRIQKSTQTENKVEAKRLHDQIKAELWNKQFLNEKPKKTWKEAVVKWIKENNQKKSLKCDILHFKWLEQYLENKYLNEITIDTVEFLIKEKEKRKNSPATINRLLALLRALLRKAKNEWEWLDNIPYIRLLKEPEHRIRWITKQEAAVLLNELPCHLRDMAAFSLSTGLRKSNVFNLKWSDIDLDRGHVTIHADESKTKTALAIPLNNTALELLLKRKDSNKEYVFTYKGKPIREYKTAWKKALERAQIKDFKWHDLRHTYASWLVMNGVSLDTVKQLLGHKSINTTLRYAHLSSEHLRNAVEKVELTIDAELRVG